MASLTRWTWVWVNSGSWWWTGKPGMLQSMGWQRVGLDWATELNWITNWTDDNMKIFNINPIIILKRMSVSQFSHSFMSNSLWPQGLQHSRLPCPSPTPGAYSNSCPWSQWCHPPISSSVVPFSSCPQSLPASGSFPVSQLFTWGGQSIGLSASASVLPMNTQDWSPLGWTCWISLPPKELSRVFSNTTVQKHQFFGTQLSS